MEKLDFDDPDYPKEAKCLISCTYKKLNEFNEDGTFNFEVMEQDLPGTAEEQLLKKKALLECQDQVTPVKDDDCESAFLFDQCLNKKIKELYKKRNQLAFSTCRKELGYEEDISNFKFDDPNFPRDAKCLIGCSYKKLNELNEDGTFNLEVLKGFITAYGSQLLILEKVVEKCYNKVTPVKDDDCESAFLFDQCLNKKIKELYKKRNQLAFSTCRKELGYEEDISNFKFDDPNYPRDAKCLIGCSYKKLNELNEDGTFNLEVLKGFITAYGSQLLILEKVIEECYNKVTPAKDDECESAFLFDLCLYKKMEEMDRNTFYSYN